MFFRQWRRKYWFCSTQFLILVPLLIGAVYLLYYYRGTPRHRSVKHGTANDFDNKGHVIREVKVEEWVEHPRNLRDAKELQSDFEKLQKEHQKDHHGKDLVNEENFDHTTITSHYYVQRRKKNKKEKNHVKRDNRAPHARRIPNVKDVKNDLIFSPALTYGRSDSGFPDLQEIEGLDYFKPRFVENANKKKKDKEKKLKEPNANKEGNDGKLKEPNANKERNDGKLKEPKKAAEDRKNEEKDAEKDPQKKKKSKDVKQEEAHDKPKNKDVIHEEKESNKKRMAKNKEKSTEQETTLMMETEALPSTNPEEEKEDDL